VESAPPSKPCLMTTSWLCTKTATSLGRWEGVKAAKEVLSPLRTNRSPDQWLSPNLITKFDLPWSETSAHLPGVSPVPPARILKRSVPLTARDFTAARASAVPIDSRCWAMISSAFLSAANAGRRQANNVQTTAINRIMSVWVRYQRILLRIVDPWCAKRSRDPMRGDRWFARTWLERNLKRFLDRLGKLCGLRECVRAILFHNGGREVFAGHICNVHSSPTFMFTCHRQCSGACAKVRLIHGPEPRPLNSGGGRAAERFFIFLQCFISCNLSCIYDYGPFIDGGGFCAWGWRRRTVRLSATERPPRQVSQRNHRPIR